MLRVHLVATVFLFIHLGTNAQADKTCIDFLGESDTLITWFHDKNVYQPVKRKIEITKFSGRWFKVVYEDSNGKIGKRRIHAHRIKKYLKKFNKLVVKTKTITTGFVEVGTTNHHCTIEIKIPIENAHECEKLQHILKIWVKKT